MAWTKKKWLQLILWVMLSPVLLFILLMGLLYITPIQNYIVKEVTDIASEKSGMHIQIGRIDLRFPLNLLVTDVTVVDPKLDSSNDTLLNMKRVNVHIQALPLLHKKVEIDNVSLEQGYLNSATLIKDMRLEGKIGSLNLFSHGVDLSNEHVLVNNVELNDSHISLTIDTLSAKKDTVQQPINWVINVEKVKIANSGFTMNNRMDSMQLSIHLPAVEASDIEADLKNEAYLCKSLALTEGGFAFQKGADVSPAKLDATHIGLQHLLLDISNVVYDHKNIKFNIHKGGMMLNNGFEISSLSGEVKATSNTADLSKLIIKTPTSYLNLSGLINYYGFDHLDKLYADLSLNALIGKEDILLMAGVHHISVYRMYPNKPIAMKIKMRGGLDNLEVPLCEVNMPGIIKLTAQAGCKAPTDSLQRDGWANLSLQGSNLEFVTHLLQEDGGNRYSIPKDINMMANATIQAQHIQADWNMAVEEGSVDGKATFDGGTEHYEANLDVKDFPVESFLPNDSIQQLSLTAKVVGKGFDFKHRSTSMNVDVDLQQVKYKLWNISDVTLDMALKQGWLKWNLASANALVRMQSHGNIDIVSSYLKGDAHIDARNINLYELGLLKHRINAMLPLTVNTTLAKDSIALQLKSGDMNLAFTAPTSLNKFLSQVELCQRIISKEMEKKRLNHKQLREKLPVAHIALKTGDKNLMGYLLKDKGIDVKSAQVDLHTSPDEGVQLDANMLRLKVDTLQLDTITFKVRQDTASMHFMGMVINGPKNPQASFTSIIDGMIANDSGNLNLKFLDKNGKVGVDFGVTARPLTEGHGKGDGFLFRITPEQPIFAFRKFHFENERNWVYVHKNNRVFADVLMKSDDGLGFSVQSDKNDPVSLQNLNIVLSRLKLDELSDIMPYMPHLSGLFTLEANYIQTQQNMQLSAEASINGLAYEHRNVGNIGMGLTWLPDMSSKHYLNSYLMINDEEVMNADGILHQKGNSDSIKVTTVLNRFPLHIADAFIPDDMANLKGVVNGNMNINGTTKAPVINGKLNMVDASVYSKQAGTLYHIEDNPILIKKNNLLFNNFTILTTGDSPFIIDGNINFNDFSRPKANLTLFADDYTVLDAPRTKESLIYGKAFVDISATIKGPLSALTMRGHMDVLGKTNLTYVLTDSPLTVQNRLSGLVEFSSFNETSSAPKESSFKMPLGGMNLNMTLHIDDAVRVRADLTPDRSKYIELEGGGDLAMKYNAQGEIGLTGRYTITGGVMKYSLPIIPLNEFMFVPGSYVAWKGNPMNPTLDLKATEKMRATVTEDNGQSRPVNFDVSVLIKNSLSAPDLSFDISAPDDASVENQLAAMSFDERNKQAITMLATGIYLNNLGKGPALTMDNALNSILQSQINALTSSIQGASLSVGVENRNTIGNKQTDYSFRYSQRFFNNRVNVIIGGKVSTGANATNTVQSFIDNLSLEYRLDNAGTKYIRLFYDKNYESLLDGEVTEGGIGVVLKKKMDHLGELFIFQKKKKKLKTGKK